MNTATVNAPKIWTAEDLLAMPDDGVERWIIGGQLREQPSEFPEAKLTVRNRHHCSVMLNESATLKLWLRQQPKPRGEAFCGEVGVLLPGRSTTFGVDVVYAAAEVVEVQDDDESTLLRGVPTLAVEILSPNDSQSRIHEKTREYLRAGVAIVWVVDPEDQTVRLYQTGRPPQSFNIEHHLPEHPAMPGFAPAVAEFFE